MLPEPATIKEEEKPIRGSRDIKPHVAHLVLKNLRNISERWWSEIETLLNSKNVNDRKFAITEVNKVQLKSMPNQLSTEEGVSISVNIVNYGEKNSDTAQLYPKTVPGTVVKSD